MEPIAIIGMACRFPGAVSLKAFWHLLTSGLNAAGEVPKTRWDIDSFYDNDTKVQGKMNCREAGFIEDVDLFDASFFNISPREAKQMDPQQRILLELTYEALEDAGIASKNLSGSDTAVYIGVMSNDYLRHQTADNYKQIDVHTGGGAGYCMLANRLSYQFGFHGPSVAIDSACSSSLVAVFQACQALWTEQSSLAIAGGVNLMLDPSFSIFYTKGGLSAPDGRCKTFSADANGIGRGEGAGIVLLKKESDALRDGDPIYAVIRGGAVNHGGHSNGITSPNRWAQAKLFRSALRHSGIDAKKLQYIELHGTGTYIGDPIEANALGEVFQESERTDPCMVGSVKSNIGHLEGAAGIAGFIKLALCLYHRQIPASIGYSAPNPVIDFEHLPLVVNTQLTNWPKTSDDKTCFAGINSFGLGGTNAHLVLSSAPINAATQEETITQNNLPMLLLSGRNEAALKAQARQYQEFLLSDVDIQAVCMGALHHRDIHEYRLCLLGHDQQLLRQALNDYLANNQTGQWISGHYKVQRYPVEVLVPQISTLSLTHLAQWLSHSPVAQSAWSLCSELIKSRTGNSLPELDQLTAHKLPDDFDELALWCFSAQYAMLQQLVASLPLSLLKIKASGTGQLAACVASGALSLHDAFNWLANQLSSPVPETSDYQIECECSGVVNPALNEIDWTAAMNKRCELKEIVATVVVNPDNQFHEFDNALYCLTGNQYDFGYLFARLAMVCQLKWSSLGKERFIKLPHYPWQRESFWLPRPSTYINIQPEQTTLQSLANATNDHLENLHFKFKELPENERKNELLSYLQVRVASALHMSAGAIDNTQPLNSLGIDSLTAVEIKNRIERDLLVKVPVVKFLDGFSIADFTDLISTEIDSINIPSSQPISAPTPLFVTFDQEALPDDVREQVAHMSSDQIDALLAQLTQEAV